MNPVTIQSSSPEQWHLEAIDKVFSESLAKSTFHLSQSFVKDPNGCSGIVTLFAVCDDALVPALRERLDATVSQFFKEHGLQVVNR